MSARSPEWCAVFGASVAAWDAARATGAPPDDLGVRLAVERAVRLADRACAVLEEARPPDPPPPRPAPGGRRRG